VLDGVFTTEVFNEEQRKGEQQGERQGEQQGEGREVLKGVSATTAPKFFFETTSFFSLYLFFLFFPFVNSSVLSVCVNTPTLIFCICTVSISVYTSLSECVRVCVLYTTVETSSIKHSKFYRTPFILFVVSRFVLCPTLHTLHPKPIKVEFHLSFALRK
jgi:hypothetical protein